MPVDATERATIEALVVCEIKLARLDQLEMRALDQALADEIAEPVGKLPSLSTLDRYRGRIMRERRELEARLESLKNARSDLVGETAVRPEALRYLADLAERKAAAGPTSAPASVANDDGCTNKPDGQTLNTEQRNRQATMGPAESS